MSRTTKDKPTKFLYPQYSEWQMPDKRKRSKTEDTNWYWLQSTPSWWNNLFHTRPRRNAAHVWEVNARKSSVEDLEELDKPNVSNKPHKYYW